MCCMHLVQGGEKNQSDRLKGGLEKNTKPTPDSLLEAPCRRHGDLRCFCSDASNGGGREQGLLWGSWFIRSVKNTFVSNENNKDGLRAKKKKKHVSHMLIIVNDQKSRISIMC